MLRYLLLAGSIIILVNACGEKNKQTKLSIPIVRKKQSKIIIEEVKTFKKKAIALVQYGDTVYHCSDLNRDECGITAECGEYQLFCVKNLTVEYLK
jgi:hypothetical protein